MALKVLCEYFEKPFGIDQPFPRFSWRETGNKYGKQNSYRLKVATDKGLKDLVWDTGVVSSNECVNIIYAGKPLISTTEYYYQVEIVDSDGESQKSEVSRMVTGLFNSEEWKAPFEGIPTMANTCQLCRMEYQITSLPVRAYSFVISPNYYELTVNGKKTTNTVLNNANTDPTKRLPYLMEDITIHLREGKNVFGINLGHGWPDINSSLNNGDGISEVQFSMQLLLIDERGNRDWVYTSHKDWKYTFDGPMIKNSIYGGEVYDARREIPEWDTPSYVPGRDRVTWNQMVEFEGFAGAQIVSQSRMEPIEVCRLIKPIEIYPLKDGSYTFDFGQNFSGWTRLSVHGKTGQKLTLSYAEKVHGDHSLDKLSLRKAKSIDEYICNGKEMEIYEPRFTYHGFRYVNVKGLKDVPDKELLTGCVVRSNIRKIGKFQCSNEMLNQLFSNVNWTEASNQHGLPTDCPQRDERLGWTNDMTVRCETALYNFDTVKLYTKWMGDIRDAQGENTGAYTDTAPYLRFGSRPEDPVAASPVLIPWNVYRFYKDKRIIIENYEANKRWAAYLERIAVNEIMPYSHMGDWAGPMNGTIAGELGREGIGGGAVSVITPTRLVATAYYYYIHVLLQKQAALLGKTQEQHTFQVKAKVIKEAFIQEYYHPKEKYVGTNSQGCNVIALYMGLVPEEDIPTVMQHLVEDIVEKHHTHLTTGNLCSRYIVEVLFKYGYPDVAYDLMVQDTYPSWGYMVKRGATTIWERWEEVNDANSILANMASCNHPMNGAFAIAFSKYLGGISPDDETPGFGNTIIRPYVPLKLRWVQCSLETMHGTVSVSWKKENKQLLLDIIVPFNSTADIFVPCAGTAFMEGEPLTEYHTEGTYRYAKVHVQAGKYHFSVKVPD